MLTSVAWIGTLHESYIALVSGVFAYWCCYLLTIFITMIINYHFAYNQKNRKRNVIKFRPALGLFTSIYIYLLFLVINNSVSS